MAQYTASRAIKFMKAKEFVEKLEKLTPSLSSLMGKGFSKQGAERLINSYKVYPKESNLKYENELLNLINNYNTSMLEISVIFFDLFKFPNIRTKTENY